MPRLRRRENLESDGHSMRKPPWKTIADCASGAEFLNDSQANRSQWVCEGCMPEQTAPRQRPDSKTCAQERMVDGTNPDPQPDLLFIPCPFSEDCLWNETRNTSCVEGTMAGCSVCMPRHLRKGNHCEPCESGEIAMRAGILIAILAVLVCVVWYARRRILRYHHKITAAWRDCMLLVKVLVNFTQINLALPSMMAGFDWKFPVSYTEFLKSIGIAELDFIHILGFECVVEMDYTYSVLFAFMIPVMVCVACAAGLLFSRRREARSMLMTSPEQRRKGFLSCSI